MRLNTIIASFILAILMCAVATSQVRESFNYPAGVLDGQGTATGGWGGPWEFYVQGGPDATKDSTQFVVDDFPYGDLDYDVPHTGNSQYSMIDTASREYRYGRFLDHEWTDDGSTYWISVLMQLSNATCTSIWAGVGVYDSTSEGPLLGKGWGDDVYSLGSGAPADSEKSLYTWDYGPVWLVAKIVTSGTSGEDVNDDMFYMWVNPDPEGSEPDEAEADVSHFGRLYPNDKFNRICVHYGDYCGVTGLELRVDEIRLGTTWDDVSSSIPDDVKQVNNTIPAKYSLSQNYPNPFNPKTNIQFDIPEAGFVTLKVYNLIGQEVSTLVNEYKNAGTYKVDFEAANLPSGIYLYKIDVGNYSSIKKMILMK